MADFRKVVIALAVLVFMAGLANAQPFACTTSFVRPILRAEGLTELIGDIVFDCTGSVGSANLVNFTVFTDARITSRTASGTSGVSEALLLINDPGGATNPAGTASLAPTGLGCTGIAATACTYNTFRGVLSAPDVAAHSVTFLGVPVVPAGTSARFRITNIRINASDIFGGAAQGAVVDVNARLAISPSEAFNFEPASGVVGRVQVSKQFAVIKGLETPTTDQGFLYRQCVDIAGSKWTGYFRFRELFATAFKKQVDTATGQIVPGIGYNTESGLQPVGITDVGTTADWGTRLRVTFNNIPAGVAVFVSNGNVEVDPTLAGAALLHIGGQTAPFEGTGDSAATAEEVTLDENGHGVAIWEVFTPITTANEDFNFGFYFEATANPQASPEANKQGTVTGNYAPTPTSASTATAWANAMHTIIPRFVDPGTSANLIFIAICRTNLLFPYVLGGVGGFDTGIAITNTSTDPFDTTPQSGTCTLNFYGANAPAKFVTPSIGQKTTDHGAIWANTAMNLASAFTGYIIAQCDFQYAHGFAFVSDIGARNIAMGYLALILPDVDAIGSRPTNGLGALTSAETLGQ